ncbi:MAG: 2-hydroxyacid dehydrogenase [Candidatus Aureabacteria bacterium]|nr:2-hydroxyacid dehydrogenase [Candidatus Auribacterota bacterium]
MNSPKIAFFDAKPYDMESFDNMNKEFGMQIKYIKNHLTADMLSLTQGHDAICVFVNDFLNQEVISGLIQNGIRLIAIRAAGYNNVDLRAVFGKIHVVRVPAYSPHAVAEHAAALILTLNRKTHKAYYRTRDFNFSLNGLMGFDLTGKTAGIIGTGKIGKILIKILKGFDMKVLAYDSFPDQSYATQCGFQYTDLDTLYRESDIISLHCPLTKETRHIINKDSILRMKEGVMIINTGRGGLIDTQALIDALKTKKIGCAGLDVYEEESEYFFEDFSDSIITDDTLARLLSFNNVLITSHQGFFTKEAISNIARTTLENIHQYFQSGQLTNEICYKCEASTCRKKINGTCF